ncbi:MAG: hypothetical protein JF593_11225 [Novosphingobium sp.]|nr:hypothetical protein [Novosphingobium sp.]
MLAEMDAVDPHVGDLGDGGEVEVLALAGRGRWCDDPQAIPAGALAIVGAASALATAARSGAALAKVAQPNAAAIARAKDKALRITTNFSRNRSGQYGLSDLVES